VGLLSETTVSAAVSVVAGSVATTLSAGGVAAFSRAAAGTESLLRNLLVILRASCKLVVSSPLAVFSLISLFIELNFLKEMIF
jgi:hypothetical protein